MADAGLQPSADIARRLEEVRQSLSTAKPAGYMQILNKDLLGEPPSGTLAQDLVAWLANVLDDTLSIVASRPLLASFADRFGEIADASVKIEVGKRAAELLQPKVVSYEEQDTKIKLVLADAYESQEDYTSSARTLQTITLDSSQRAVSADDKAKIWIRIVRCYLEEEDPTSAATYLNRLKTIVHEVTDNAVKLQFQLSQARILDSQRSFLDASGAYLAVSFEPTVDEEERLQSLSAAITCAVLAPAGPQRSRTLGRLYKDERAPQVDEFSILEKIFLDRLLSTAEVQAFAQKLQPHQLAKTADGSTVLDKAVLEHNLLGASRLYANIGIAELGVLLGVDGDKAEQYAAEMIEQGRLAGYIDQIDGLIIFKGEGSGERMKSGQKHGVVGKEIKKWDMNVEALAEEVEKITTMIQSHRPELYALHMAA
ncbi:COP9 signalosome-like protein complex subunit 4 [Cryomyces antarcticus]